HGQKGLLQRMEIAVPLQALDGGNLFALDRGRLCQAGAHGPPVNQHGTGAALSLATAVFRAGQIKLVAQHAEQGALAVNLDAASASVDLKFQNSHISFLTLHIAHYALPIDWQEKDMDAVYKNAASERPVTGFAVLVRAIRK